MANVLIPKSTPTELYFLQIYFGIKLALKDINHPFAFLLILQFLIESIFIFSANFTQPILGSFM